MLRRLDGAIVVVREMLYKTFRKHEMSLKQVTYAKYCAKAQQTPTTSEFLGCVLKLDAFSTNLSSSTNPQQISLIFKDYGA